MKLKGNDLIIFAVVNGVKKALAYSTTCEITLTLELVPISSEQTGKWKGYTARKKDWSVRADAILSDVMQEFEVSAFLESGVNIYIGSVEAHPNQIGVNEYIPDGKISLNGNALVQRYSISAQKSGKVACALELVGNGELTYQRE